MALGQIAPPVCWCDLYVTSVLGSTEAPKINPSKVLFNREMNDGRLPADVFSLESRSPARSAARMSHPCLTLYVITS